MNPETGGPCQGIRNILPALFDIGIHSEVLCLDDPESEYLKNENFVIYALGKSQSPWKYHPRLYSWLLNHLPNYDIVLVRGLWLYHSYVVAKAIRALKRKNQFDVPRVYLVPHGMLDPWFQQSRERKIKSLRNNIYWHLIEKKVVREADGLLFTCETEMQLAKKTFNDYQPQSEINIGYGIQLPPTCNQFMKKAFEDKIGEKICWPFLLFLGRIHEKKGVDILVEAYRRLLNNSITLPKLIIAGPGIESSYGQKLFNIVKSAKELNDMVLFPGMLSGSAKWGALHTCEAFLLPSHQENFGIAVVEAMACSKPVLISNQINIYQDIQRAGAGIVASSTTEGVENILIKWFKLTVEEKNKMAANSRKLFESDFTAQSAAIKMLDALKL